MIKGKPLNFNVGLQKWYVKELLKLVDDLTSEVYEVIKPLYKDLKYQVEFTQDESISSQTRIALNSLKDIFEKKFKDRGKKVAGRMIRKTNRYANTTFLNMMNNMFKGEEEVKKAGGFLMKGSIITPEKEEVIKALTYENVSLITNIQTRYFEQITGAVMRSISSGLGVTHIEEELSKYKGMTKRRARNVALDQTRKAYNSINLRNMQDAGIKKAEWVHSGGGQKPRDYHKTRWDGVSGINDGHPNGLNGFIFSLDRPPVIQEAKGKQKEERGFPGQAVNCLTPQMKIVSPYLHQRLYRRKFRGETVKLITSNDLLELTPNHPVLTNKGWVKAGLLNIGDNIAKICDETIFTCSTNPNYSKISIEEFFSFYSTLFNIERVRDTSFDFHGDVAIDKQVDVINIELKLRDYLKPQINQSRIKQILTETQNAFCETDLSGLGFFYKAFPFSRFLTADLVSFFDKPFAFFFGSVSHSNRELSRAVSWLNSLLSEITIYDTTRDGIFLSKLFNTQTVNIKLYQLILWELAYSLINDNMTEPTHTQSQLSFLNAETLGKSFDSNAGLIKFDKITDKIISVFDGHIYNLQNKNHWYLTENHITKNCHCRMAAVVDFDF